MSPRPFLTLIPCALIIVLSIALGLALSHQLWFTSFLLFLLLYPATLLLVRQQQQTTNAMKKLIAAIRFSDYSQSFTHPGHKNLPPSLVQAMTEALAAFREKMRSLEEQHQYDATLLSAIDSGLIVLNSGNEIEWYNKTVLDEFRLKRLSQLSDLRAVQQDLPERLLRLRPGEITVIRLRQDDRLHEIAFNSVIFRLKGKTFTLVSLKNIHSVLEYNEIEAWQKLIRVLTHEIMNSMAPIISLSETLIERNAPAPDAEMRDTVTHQALQAIHRRSKGLLEFVENYRQLTRIPVPQMTDICVAELFAGLQKLHSRPGIRYTFSCPDPHLQLRADRTQIEQVLINLIRNAEEACHDTPSPHIQVTASTASGRVLLSISDNGTGIVPEAIDKIFVPFFTTKPGGSGIGLSLCKQIITRHHGNITVSSRPGEGCTFQLLF